MVSSTIALTSHEFGIRKHLFLFGNVINFMRFRIEFHESGEIGKVIEVLIVRRFDKCSARGWFTREVRRPLNS